MGKTSLALNIAGHVAAARKKPVLLFNMEMPKDKLYSRIISSFGRVDQQKLRTGNLSDNDWPRITSAISFCSDFPLFIDNTFNLSPAMLCNKARRLYRDQGEIGLIVNTVAQQT